ARIKLLEYKDKGTIELSGDDAPIKGMSLETEEEAGVERSTERGSNDTEEMVNVLTFMDAANILTSGVADVSVPPAAKVLTIGVPTGSGLVPTVSAIFTTASVVTPYSRRKEMEEKMAREDQRIDEQIARDAKIVRIHVEEELQMLIDGLDINNEVIAKHLQEYKQSEAELIIGEKINLINEQVKYQDHHAKILKYQAQQSKPLSKKERREFYIEKFIPIWKQIEDFVPMASKEEGERVKKKGLKLEQGSAKRMKTSEDVSEEDLKEMMQLVPLEEVYVEALQSTLPLLVKKCSHYAPAEEVCTAAEIIKQHNMVEKDEFNRLSKSFSKLKQHYISLELAMLLNKEIFQKNNTSVNETKPSFDQLFELYDLKVEFQAKYITIEKLKAKIKRSNKPSTTNIVKKDIYKIETINIELEHRVIKLTAKNKHLKQTYKQLYDSINPSRVLAKEHAKSVVNKLNQKKIKGKDIVDNAAQVSNATIIAPRMYKFDPVTLAPKDKNNRETHIYYLKHTMEQAVILREIVEQAKSLNPLDSASYSVCKYVKLIQEFLGYVRDTCPDIYKPSKRLVTVTPINKKKTV
nr:hypothetical protein [Tanacetum cinerariifolium]